MPVRVGLAERDLREAKPKVDDGSLQISRNCTSFLLGEKLHSTPP